MLCGYVMLCGHLCYVVTYEIKEAKGKTGPDDHAQI